MDTFLKILTLLYAIGGVVTFFGYFPTVRDLWKKIPSANLWTYGVWTITMALTSLYGFFVLKNLVFNFVVNLQLFACVLIFVLRLRLNFLKK